MTRALYYSILYLNNELISLALTGVAGLENIMREHEQLVDHATAHTLPDGAAPAWTPARSASGKHNPWLICWMIAIPMFMEVLDTSIAQVSLKHIAGSLAATSDESTWVITSYLVANSIILPISSWLSDIIGRKRFFILCIGIFTIASFLCGCAQSLPMLVVFRIIQGLGGGGMVPISQSILADSFPPEKRGMAFAVWALAVIVSPVIGPPLGGWITDSYSWPWIFYINVPVGIFSVIICQVLLDEPPLLVMERKRLLSRGIRMDYIGFAFAAIGLVFLEVTTSKGEQKDWFESSFVRVTAAISAGSLLLMAVWEWFQKDPVVDVKLFKIRSFAACMIVMFISGMVLFISNTLLPMLLQGVHGYTSLWAGLAMLPGGVASALGMIVVGVLTRFVQLRILVLIGILAQIIPFFLMSFFPPNLTFWQAAGIRSIQACGLGFIFIPIVSLSYEGLNSAKTNMASAMTNAARNIGGSVGIALANTWVAQRIQIHHSNLAEHINPYNPMVEQAAGGIQSALGGDPAGGLDAKTLMSLDGMVNQQAAVMAFNDVFMISALLCLGAAILIFILPANKPGHGDVAMH